MAPHEPRTERRIAGGRSDPVLSLSNLLEAARHESHVEALALADDTGLLIAGAGAFRLCETLSAFAPFLSDATWPANDIIPTRLDVLETTSVRRIRIDGVEVLLCARGGKSERGASLDRAEDGVRRILSSRRPRGSLPT